jgi:hypothetical protein
MDYYAFYYGEEKYPRIDELPSYQYRRGKCCSAMRNSVSLPEKTNVKVKSSIWVYYICVQLYLRHLIQIVCM